LLLLLLLLLPSGGGGIERSAPCAAMPGAAAATAATGTDPRSGKGAAALAGLPDMLRGVLITTDHVAPSTAPMAPRSFSAGLLLQAVRTCHTYYGSFGL
jgi:hypothetical protein